MKLVVDTSVATKWAVIENDHQQALDLIAAGHELLAPSILLSEVANALWKKHRRGEIDQEQAIAGLIAVRPAIASMEDASLFVEQALRIAIELDHPVYDCIYIACAMAMSARLVTADRRLAAATRGRQYERLLVNFPE